MVSGGKQVCVLLDLKCKTLLFHQKVRCASVQFVLGLGDVVKIKYSELRSFPICYIFIFVPPSLSFEHMP